VEPYRKYQKTGFSVQPNGRVSSGACGLSTLFVSPFVLVLANTDASLQRVPECVYTTALMVAKCLSRDNLHLDVLSGAMVDCSKADPLYLQAPSHATMPFGTHYSLHNGGFCGLCKDHMPLLARHVRQVGFPKGFEKDLERGSERTLQIPEGPRQAPARTTPRRDDTSGRKRSRG
jgi:hypothetical protein